MSDWSVFHFSTPATSSQEKTFGSLRGLPSIQAKTRHCDWLLAPFLVSSRTSLATAAPTLTSPESSITGGISPTVRPAALVSAYHLAKSVNCSPATPLPSAATYALRSRITERG